jgi:DNA repair exonuclease SbcCD nuclease subunit
LGELANLHKASFIVVAGDVFESNQLSRQTVSRTLDALEALPVPVFLLPGNHDPVNASSIFLTEEFINSSDHIIVLYDTKPRLVPGESGVEVVGAPWRTKHPSSDLCAELTAALEPSSSILRIAVCHGQVDTLSPDKSRPEIIDLATAEAAIRDGKIHYLALGDRHSVTDVGASGKIWYSGAPVATDFDEIEPNKALLVELNQNGNCELKQLDVGNWTFIVDQNDINTDEDFEQIRAFVTGLPNKACTVLKIGFTGTINLAIAAKLDELFEAQAESFASIRRRERTTNLAILPDELDQDSLSLNGYAKDTWDELLESAAHDESARDALRLFYRLSQRGERA